MRVGDLSVLLIEDNPQMIEIAKRALELERIAEAQIQVVMNEEEAIYRLMQKDYHLVICNTIYGEDYPIGPNIATLLKELGKNPIIVGLRTVPTSEKLWSGLAHYLFAKFEFYGYDRAGLKKVLGEKFGIK